MSATGKEFHLGLTMSGAISAGAYTAGVLDFLIQALDEWEKVRDGGQTVPDHRVGLKVMSGASAGAITAAIGAIALADGGQAPGVHRDGTGRALPYHLPKLYEAWVVKPALQDEAGIGLDLLSPGDLEKPIDPTIPPGSFLRTHDVTVVPTGSDDPPVASLLNVAILALIAEDALEVPKLPERPRAYIAETLHVYMTLTNLRGVPYRVPFKGGDYHMMTHGDRMHHAIAGAGTWATESAFSDDDAGRSLLAKWLLKTASPADQAKWRDFAVGALASSAFPVGLAPRVIGGPLTDYAGRKFPNPELVEENEKPILPEWPASWSETTEFSYTTADGGIIDNDPFEYAHFAVKERGKLSKPIEAHPKDVERAVIMISPFPEAKPIRPAGQPTIDLASLVAALFPSLIDQARFKPDALALAAKEDHASRYLIGPSRTKRVGDRDVDERYGIASGLLGGFGGFVARSFRDHDFQLGRRNCQRFLQTSFALPLANPLVAQWQAAGIDISKFAAVNSKAEEGTSYCLIPLFGSAREEVPALPWPRISQAQFDHLLERIGARFDYVAPKLLSQNIKGLLGTLIGFVLLPGVRDIPGLIRPRVLNYVRLTILADLVRRDQIEGWSLPSGLALSDDDVRLVLAELLEPKFDQRNVNGIAAAVAATPGSDPDPQKIRKVLDALKSASGNCKVWEAPWKDNAGGSLFTLDSRKPNLFEGIIGGRLKLALTPNVDPPGM